MNIIAWLVFGLIAGILANVIFPESSKGGMLSAIVLGVAGAIIGGFVSSMFLGVGVTGFNLVSLVIAVAGSLILLYGWRMLDRS